MTVDQRIREALLPFGDPVENGNYLSEESRYYTFNYSTIGDDYADDAPQHERYLVQVHFFAPVNENIAARRKATKRALFEAGFTWPESDSETDAESRHVVFECEYAEDV